MARAHASDRRHKAGCYVHSRLGSLNVLSAQIVRTLAAFRPFGPSCTSYSTFAPSASDLKPLPAIAEWWTNTSLPSSSGVMKPNPFSSLNHFTVPVAIAGTSVVLALRSEGYSHQRSADARRGLASSGRRRSTPPRGGP